MVKGVDEPAHVHVEKDECIAKLWLGPVRTADDGGPHPADLRRAILTVEEHEQEFLERFVEWHGAPRRQ